MANPFEGKDKKNKKLAELAKSEGYDDPLEFLGAYQIDSVVPGICMTDGCKYTTGVEPDQSAGWCEECDKGTVMSCLILADII